ncbi:amino acid/polyamine/organocation transporter, APC superfamily [Streptomyces sp. DvalAA-14]|uniref:APC family permease n=1 Tax=unclassified Streptomyces TaxID=2593676 RepID=UPI00081AF816|nr:MULTISPECIES: APC family permease [unclassified Streptomyces]MYS18870.1 amino acid permease [Streptomyces sp. SID4948]SCD30843.1 amino acid/polyamine/organocation transporter, APC superfamily [Streptomyces sp. DvalAA-14]
MTTTARLTADPASEDQHLKRELGFWHLTGISLGGVIGSGWLLAPMKVANAAGPAAVVSWAVGGLVLVLMSLVLVELGASVPLSGGLVRWPFHSSGRLVGTMAGWSIWIAYAINPPSEAAAMVQYLSLHVPRLHLYLTGASRLSTLGMLVCFAIMIVFVVVNWYGVRLFARVNLAFTIGKFAFPVLTAVALFASGFHAHNVTAHHGFAPFGYDPALTAITTSGVFFAYTGFQGPLDLAGEARNAKRDIPRAVVAALVLAIFVYIALQIAFIGAVPRLNQISGWHGVDTNSTFVDLAKALNLGWLFIVLQVGAVASPGGSSMVYTAESGRSVYAMGLNGLLPAMIARVHRGSGIPRRALVVNTLIGTVFLFTLQKWSNMVAVASALTLFGYSLSLVSEQAIKRRYPELMAGWVRGTRIIAPASFVFATELFYRSTWSHVRIAVLVLVSAAVLGYGWEWFNQKSGMRDLASGAWLVAYLIALAALSKLGNYGGMHLHAIPVPADSLLAALIGFAGYWFGLRGAARHLRVNEPLLEDLAALRKR